MRYYFGSNVASSHLEASPANKFKDLADRHINAVCTINLTQVAYKALEKHEKDKKKRVSFLVPASFTTPTATRLYENATVCHLLFLDIDLGKHAAPFVTSPEKLAEQMAPFNFVAYHTASSTPDEPRIRIMVDAEGIPKEDYGLAVRTIAAHIGLPHVTRESTVAVQPMFLPSLFLDQDPEVHHPVFVSNYDGRAFLPSDICEDVMVDTYVEDSKSLRAKGGKDDLAFLRSPLPEITLEIATEALASLSPEMSYFQWFDIACALKHQFSHTEPGGALTLFDEWSSPGSTYPGTEVIEYKWRSIRPSPIGRVPVTIRTLLSRAKDAGWGGADAAKELCYQSIVNWASHEAVSGVELMTQGVSKIAALPLLSNAEESSLLSLIAKAAKERFEAPISTAALRKDLDRLKALMNVRDQAKKRDCPPWAMHICYVSTSNEFYHIATREKFSIDAFNNRFSRHLLPTDEQINSSDGKLNANAPTCSPQSFLLNQVQCYTVSDYIYDPTKANEVFIQYDGREFVNLYNDTSYPIANPEGADEAGDIFLAHLEVLVKELEYRRIVMDFMAFIVQNPGIKIRWALLLQGAQGGGKTTLVECLRFMLGDSHVKLVDTTAIKGNYNEWATGAQVVAIEEIRVHSANKFDVMDVLKPLISNTRAPINEKFKNTKTVFNVSNYICLTNYHNAIAINNDDRRYCIIKSRIQTLADVTNLGENYFVDLYTALENKGPALKWFFQHWDISDKFNANGHAPITKYRSQVIHDSACELTAAVRRYLEEGENPLIQKDLISSTALKAALQMDGVKHNDVHLGNVLREENFEAIDRIQIAPGERHYFWRKVGMLNGTTDIAAVARGRANAVMDESI